MYNISGETLKAVKIIVKDNKNDYCIRKCFDTINKIMVTEELSEKLYKALKLNITNRKKYPAVVLIDTYKLPLSLSTFKRIKYHLCYTIAKEFNLI